MARKVKSGSIYQINLPNDLGFAYAKCINLLELNQDARYPTLIRVYNYRSLVPLVSTEKFIYKELILCPLLIAGILPAIKSGSWKLIASESFSENEMVIPIYKWGEPDDFPSKWYYVPNADISKKVKSEYNNVMHLEMIGAVGAELVGVKIAMALLQDEGKRIEDYFKLEKYYEKHYYKDVVEIPAYYKQPKEIRGKVKT
nr:Imm26 family immunity protein [Pedobacter panaciterrae]